MNKAFPTLLFGVVAGAMMFVSCDNIDKDDRYIELPVAEVQRTVLLEDFTGQNCKNCPNAHEAIHALQEQYGDALIAVSIHPAGNGLVYDEATYGSAGLGTEDGRLIAASAGAGTTLPTGQVDRSTGLIDYPSWANEVRNSVERTSTITCSGAAVADSDSVIVNLSVRSGEEFKGTVNVWVLEDSVVARQLLPNGKRDNNYIHNHLLRQCITPALGRQVTYQRNVTADERYSLPVKSYWNVANIRVIAFFADENGVVEQAYNIPTENK
ncbi:MAG: Omp28 family outer membrane lipoprotein [Paramuribaculum sp.]|nr:Omp28 family outer membrane lipoprotein [Paramuribaculum sp.]